MRGRHRDEKVGRWVHEESGRNGQELTDACRAGGSIVDASVPRDGRPLSAGHDDGDLVVADASLAAELGGARSKAVAALANGLGAGSGIAERGGNVGE